MGTKTACPPTVSSVVRDVAEKYGLTFEQVIKLAADSMEIRSLQHECSICIAAVYAKYIGIVTEPIGLWCVGVLQGKIRLPDELPPAKVTIL